MTISRCPHKDAVGQQCLRVAGHPNYINYDTKLPLIDGAHDMGGVTPDSKRAWEWNAMANETEFTIRNNLLWGFKFHYHRDMMNSAVHMASPIFSPITRALCMEIEEILESQGRTWAEGPDGFLMVRETMMTVEEATKLGRYDDGG
jgi:hypothetical protein